MNRRHFLQLLGIAPLAFDPHRVYFDMGRKLWMSAQWGDPLIDVVQPEVIMPGPIVSMLNQLNAVTQGAFDAILSADGWPDIDRVRKWQSKPLDIRNITPHTTTGLGIIIP